MKKTLIYRILLCSMVLLLGTGMAMYKMHTNALAAQSKTSQTHIAVSLEHPIQDLIDNPECTINGTGILAGIFKTTPELKQHIPGITITQSLVAGIIPNDCSPVSHKEVYQKTNYISRLTGSYFQEIFIPPC